MPSPEFIPLPALLLIVLALALALVAMLLLRLGRKKRRPGAAVTPLPDESGIPLPDLDRFRPVETYFSRDHLRRLLVEMARFQQAGSYRLPPERVRYGLQRVVKRLIFAGDLARQEQLPDGDRVTLYLAVVYSHFVTPEMNPVFHTWYNAALARSRLLEGGLTRHAALKVSRAIREYPRQDPQLCRRLAYGLAQIAAAAAFEPERYGPALRQAITEVLEKSEADYRQVAQFIQENRAMDVSGLAAALYERFRETVLVYPAPSTPEMWEKIKDVDVLEPDEIHSYRQIKLYSVGTPGGNDFDFAVVNVPGMKRRHIALGPLDLFVNDANAASAILARQTMDAIYSRRPLLYEQWVSDKNVAKDMLGQGLISGAQYSGFKAMWHKQRGLPWQHYAHKQAGAEEMARLPRQLVALARPRGGGYNQLALLLHDVNLCPLPTLDTFFDYIEYFAGQRESQPIVPALDGVIAGAEAATNRMKTRYARQLLANNVEFLRYFWDTIRGGDISPTQLKAGFQLFLDTQEAKGRLKGGSSVARIRREIT